MTLTPSSSPRSIETSTESPPVRKSRRKFDFAIETLQAYAHYRQDDAARLLGVAPITLKRNCQRLRYRWPYRSIKATLRRTARSTQDQATSDAALTVRALTLPLPSLVVPKVPVSRITCSSTFVPPDAGSRRARKVPANEVTRGTDQPHLPPLSFYLPKPRVPSQLYQPSRYDPNVPSRHATSRLVPHQASAP